MLRDSKLEGGAAPPSKWTPRWIAAGLLLAATLLAGLRGGSKDSPFDAPVLAQPPAASSDARGPAGIDLSQVHNDAKGFLAFRPAEIAKVPEIREALAGPLKEMTPPLAMFTVDGIEQVTFIGQGDSPAIVGSRWDDHRAAVQQADELRGDCQSGYLARRCGGSDGSLGSGTRPVPTRGRRMASSTIGRSSWERARRWPGIWRIAAREHRKLRRVPAGRRFAAARSSLRSIWKSSAKCSASGRKVLRLPMQRSRRLRRSGPIPSMSSAESCSTASRCNFA